MVSDNAAMSFISRQLEEGNEILPGDHSLIDSTTQKNERSVTDEAVLILAALKLVSQHAANQKQFEEMDLFNDNTPSQKEKKPQLTVASETDRLKVDLAANLKTNPLLQSVKAFNLAIKTVQIGDTLEYQNSIVSIVKDKVTSWARLHQYVDGLNLSETADTSVAIVDPRSVADLREADLTIVEAERLASRKQFQQAVQLVQKIDKNSPLYRTATEKVRDFSNQAVLDLRRKAALAFQNAMPVHDLKIKQTYLNEAKDYLEMALSSYPDADQLNKIRENLAVIRRDLTSINSQLGDN